MKTKIKYGLLAVVILIIGYFLYARYISPTKIALVNFASYKVTNIKAGNSDNFFVQIDEITPNDGSDLSDYDAILLFTPGLRLTNEENIAIDKAREKGVFIYSCFFRSNVIKDTPLDSIQQKQMRAYIVNKSQENYRNMALYIRENFDKKKLFSPKAKPAQVYPTDMFYYLDSKKFFTNSKDFISYLKAEKIYKENAPRIAFCTGNVSPLEGARSYIDSLIVALSGAGYNVFLQISVRAEM